MADGEAHEERYAELSVRDPVTQVFVLVAFFETREGVARLEANALAKEYADTCVYHEVRGGFPPGIDGCSRHGPACAQRYVGRNVAIAFRGPQGKRNPYGDGAWRYLYLAIPVCAHKADTAPEVERGELHPCQEFCTRLGGKVGRVVHAGTDFVETLRDAYVYREKSAYERVDFGCVRMGK